MESTKSKFPDDFLGHWSGDLHIYNHSGKTMTVLMQIIISITDLKDEYHWHIIYGEGEKQNKRQYTLKVDDASKGRYVIDEKNSIVLDACFIENKLISSFEVNDNLLTSVYEVVNGKMIFEIYFQNKKDNRISGNSVINNDTIPEVISYKTSTYQKAVLSKM